MPPAALKESLRYLHNPGPLRFLVLFKTPRTPNGICVVLVVVVLVAITEILVPRVVRIVLGRTPVRGAGKATRHNK